MNEKKTPKKPVRNADSSQRLVTWETSVLACSITTPSALAYFFFNNKQKTKNRKKTFNLQETHWPHPSPEQQ